MIHRLPAPLLLLVVFASSAFAQTAATRAELLRQEREAKQKELRPYEPTALEKGMDLAENRIVPLLQRDGIYAKFGSLTTGSGFAYGAGFRDRSLVSGLGSLDVWAAGSLKRYWAVEARVVYPIVQGGKLNVEGYARRYEYPQENFFGLGPDSLRVNRSDFNLHGTIAGGRVFARPVAALSVGGGLEDARPRIGSGSNGKLPDTNAIFSPSSAPALNERLNFLRSSVFVEVDYRKPKNARKGGWYRVDLSHWDDRSTGEFSFDRVDVDLRQFVGFFAERRVLAGRIWASTTDPGAVPALPVCAPGVADCRRADQVPFFLQPSLGGNDTLRGFRAYRFRGPHAILLQAEYRWEIWSAFEGALFYDAGKVVKRRSDLDFSNLERDYGFGFRFNTDNGVVMRVDAAFGSRDGRHLHIVFGGVF
jgi:hypothetical protein